jgi:hypothetical protein
MQYAEPIQVLANDGKMRATTLQGLFRHVAPIVLTIQKVVLADGVSASELFAAAATARDQFVAHRLQDLATTPASATAHKILVALVIAPRRNEVVTAAPLTLDLSFADVASGGVILGCELAASWHSSFSQ